MLIFLVILNQRLNVFKTKNNLNFEKRTYTVYLALN